MDAKEEIPNEAAQDYIGGKSPSVGAAAPLLEEENESAPSTLDAYPPDPRYQLYEDSVENRIDGPAYATSLSATTGGCVSSDDCSSAPLLDIGTLTVAAWVAPILSLLGLLRRLLSTMVASLRNGNDHRRWLPHVATWVL